MTVIKISCNCGQKSLNLISIINNQDFTTQDKFMADEDKVVDVNTAENLGGEAQGGNNLAEDAFNQAVALKHKGDNRAAIAYFQKVLKMLPNNIESMYNIGLLHREEHQYQEALNYFQQGFTIEPNNHKLLYAIAATYEHIDKNEAIRYYKECEKITDNPVLNAIAQTRLQELK